MRILLVGGGSGGHVTPLRAISHSLQKQADEDLQITLMSDRAFFKQTQFLFENDQSVKLKKIFSGKYRRYNGKSLLWHLTHIPTLVKNIRDIFLFGLGFLQSMHHFIWHKPTVVFCKGGYVCVPVGLAARIFKVPLVIHDSDTHPGLTNRFLSRWAVKIGTGMPSQYYQYPKEKMLYSGIPVQDAFKPATKEQQRAAKEHLGFDPELPVLLVTGGGTGAQQLNTILLNVIEEMLGHKWQVVQLTGRDKAAKALKIKERLPRAQQKSWQVLEFAEMLPLVTAADLVISRAGATAMQEFANAQKPVILVPNPYLTGGHQLKNAAMFSDHGAARVIQEVDLKENPNLLTAAIKDLLENPKQAAQLASSLSKTFAKPNASDEIAQLILQAASASGAQ